MSGRMLSSKKSNLSQNVSLLRKALDDRGTPRYIVTVTGKGYQFAATPAVEIAEPIAVGQNLRLQAVPEPVLLPVDEALADRKHDVSNLTGSPSPAPRPKAPGNSHQPSRCSSPPPWAAGWPTHISMADTPSPNKALRRALETTAVPSPSWALGTWLAAQTRSGCPSPWRKC